MHFELAVRHRSEMLLQVLVVHTVLAASQGSGLAGAVCAEAGLCPLSFWDEGPDVPQFPQHCGPCREPGPRRTGFI